MVTPSPKPARSLLRRSLWIIAFAFGTPAILLILVFCVVTWRMASVQPVISKDYEQAILDLENEQWADQPGVDAFPIIMSMDEECDRICDHVERDSAVWKDLKFSALCDPTHKPEHANRDELFVAIRKTVSRYSSSAIPSKWPELMAADRSLHAPVGVAAWEMLSPDAGKRRKLARLCAARMYIAQETRDWSEFVVAYEQGLVLSKISSWRPFLIEQMVAAAISDLMEQELSRAMVSNTMDLSTLDALDKARRRWAPTTNLGLAVEGERRIMLDAVQRTFSDDGRGGGTQLFDRINALRDPPNTYFGLSGDNVKYLNSAGLFMRGRAETTMRVNALMDVLIETIDVDMVPYRRGHLVFAEFDGRVMSWQKYYPVIEVMTPNWLRAIRSADSAKVIRAGTGVMLGIERYRIENGRWPEDLAAIRGIDATDPLNGRPFVYRLVQPNAPTAERAYLLYSIGLDDIDNQGLMKVGRERDALMFGGVEGVDYLFNAPRPRLDDAAPGGR